MAIKSVTVKIFIPLIILFTFTLFVSVGGLFQAKKRVQFESIKLQKFIDITNSLDSVEKAAIIFNIQVKEWKNILLRGRDSSLFEKHLSLFQQYEKEAGAHMEASSAFYEKYDLSTDQIDSLIQKHRDLGSRYREALEAFNQGASHFEADRLVRGADKEITNSIFEITEELKTLLNDDFQESLEMFRYFTDILTKILFIIIGAALLTVVISGFYLIQVVLKPIKRLTDCFKELAGGKGDLTVRMRVKTQDELKILTDNFNYFMDFVHSVMSRTKISADSSREVSERLEHTAGHSSQLINAICKSVEDVHQNLINQEEAVQNYMQGADEERVAIGKMNELIHDQALQVKSASKMIDSLIYENRKVEDISEKKLESLHNLSQITSGGKHEMQMTLTVIRKVTQSANVMLEIAEVINDIADKTNLLAMNAAIEASHAGEAGKGFSVVAAEIRKLSENTTKNADVISRSLREIINDIKQSESTAEKTGVSFTRIAREIEGFAVGFSDIKKGVTEVSSRIGNAVELLTETVAQEDLLSRESYTLLRKVDENREQISHVSNLSKKSAGDVSGFSMWLEGISEEMNLLAGIGKANSTNIENLLSMLAMLKLEQKDEPQ